MSRQGDQRAGVKPSLLLHVCCAPCSTRVIDLLRGAFEVTAFFYNPNIFPPAEYLRRAQEADRLCQRLGVGFIAGDYDAHRWSQRMRGRERDHEGGAHCSVCFRIRLTKTSTVAEEGGFDYFATTLTISPHKDARAINRIGEKVVRGRKTKFYPADFKKGDGFKKSCQLSRRYGLYRQDYCGCVFSLRERNERGIMSPNDSRTEARRKR